MASLVARHGNGPSRQKDVLKSGHGNKADHLFYPHRGRMGDNLGTLNLLNAEEGHFAVSCPWLMKDDVSA